MTPTVKHLNEAGFKEPMVVFPLKQYVSLMEAPNSPAFKKPINNQEQ